MPLTWRESDTRSVECLAYCHSSLFPSRCQGYISYLQCKEVASLYSSRYPLVICLTNTSFSTFLGYAYLVLTCYLLPENYLRVSSAERSNSQCQVITVFEHSPVTARSDVFWNLVFSIVHSCFEIFHCCHCVRVV